MSIQLRKEVAAKMEAALASGGSEQFIREDDKTFMRYDEIRVSSDPDQVVKIDFVWHGAICATLYHQCSLLTGQVLVLGRMEGRTPVHVA